MSPHHGIANAMCFGHCSRAVGGLRGDAGDADFVCLAFGVRLCGKGARAPPARTHARTHCWGAGWARGGQGGNQATDSTGEALGYSKREQTSRGDSGLLEAPQHAVLGLTQALWKPGLVDALSTPLGPTLADSNHGSKF